MAWVLASIALLCARHTRPASAFSLSRLSRPLHSSSPLPNLTVSGDAALVERLTRLLQQRQRRQPPCSSVPAELALLEGRLSVRFPSTELKPFCVDLTARAVASRAADPGSATLVRALRGSASAAEQQVVFDLTAGLGRDAVTAARAGLQVVMVERHPVIWAMLSDALERLGADEPRLAERMRLVHADARELATESLQRSLHLPKPDVVFLDPMYAPRTKSAKVKKEMQVLHLLLGDRTEDEQAQEDEALFAAARALNPRRIVVKRHINAPPLVQSAKASGSVKGSTQRFDIYATTTPGPDAPAT